MGKENPQKLWEAALGELQLQISRAQFETWLKQTVGLSHEDTDFVVGVPQPFAAEWLAQRLKPQIEAVLRRLTGAPGLQVRFQVQGAVDCEASPLLQEPASEPPRPNLSPRYVFQRFIVGSSNRLAFAAAQGVAQSPGTAYNPLFLYGGVGLGKTHLLHAIGHATVAKHLRTVYVSAEQFTNEFINAIKERRTDEFRAKYRGADVLLMDDIQFISGKEQTQEGFFHTFNELHNASRQIVITSDRSPQSMPLLEDRLKSRFHWGLIADIQPPDLETRIAILRAKAEEQHLRVPQETLELIARRVQKNIRELEGGLNRVAAFAKVSERPLNPELATQALADSHADSTRRKNLTPELILDTVAQYYKVEAAALNGPRRSRGLVNPRHIAMYLMREEGNTPYTEIGRLIGGRDHSTVLHACARIARAMNSDGHLRQDLLSIKELL
ncbi:MAG: chromosomal replication initiator protein DnaA, partial [Chloroflexi bacterium]|nr:chromosomal replication initiator protein DnaA [Chloroflexota bacterium]